MFTLLNSHLHSVCLIVCHYSTLQSLSKSQKRITQFEVLVEIYFFLKPFFKQEVLTMPDCIESYKHIAYLKTQLPTK